MKMHSIALALAGLASLHTAAHAQSIRDWGYWDSSTKVTAPTPSTAVLLTALYVSAVDGMVIVSNPASATSFSAGQFGFLPTTLLPQIVMPPPRATTLLLPPESMITGPSINIPVIQPPI